MTKLPDLPSGYDRQVIWEGLGLIDVSIIPHYKSHHPESPAIDEVVDYCFANEIPFKALRDGEVVVRE